MKIPQKFMLAGLWIEVVLDTSLFRDKGLVGEAQYSAQRIVLDPSCCTRPQLEQAFYHERKHWIYFVLNEPDLRNNEKLVDLEAYLEHQADDTATGEQ